MTRAGDCARCGRLSYLDRSGRCASCRVGIADVIAWSALGLLVVAASVHHHLSALEAMKTR